MSQAEKLMAKAQRNPQGLSFKDFCTLLGSCGWVKDRQKGSHQIWIAPHGPRLCIQNKDGKAKGYQVQQFFRLHNQRGDEDE